MSLTTDAARRAATQERDRLQRTPRWRIAYAGAEAEQPLLVKATPPVRDYFIVQFRQDNRTSGVMLVNPESGKIGSISGIQTAGASLSRFLRPHEVPRHLSGYRRELISPAPGTQYDDFRDRLVAGFEEKNLTVDAELFWESCDQSLTPFYPFYKVAHVLPERTDHFLVRIDGNVHAAATHGGRGL